MSSAGKRKLVLEDGQVYIGDAFGADGERILELVFNTSMVGYQEILSDPSYTDQAVVMTYPLIGNYGMADDDYESLKPTIGALVVREYNDEPSNFRSTRTLGEVMKQYGIVGLSGVDTRKLARSVRDYGSRLALLTDAETPLAECLSKLREYTVPTDAVSRVSTKEEYVSEAVKCGKCEAASGNTLAPSEAAAPLHVVAIDCGMKQNIVRSLNRRGCKVTVVPWNTSAEIILSKNPDGVFISNGPGDPTDVPETIETIRNLIGKKPIFGICLGHQILSLAFGAKTYKLKFGHRGGNHPVKELASGKIEITSQNHSYAVDLSSLSNTPLAATHINLLDNTVEGVACKEKQAFSVQYHPESAPGPQDSSYLFDRFINLMRTGELSDSRKPEQEAVCAADPCGKEAM